MECKTEAFFMGIPMSNLVGKIRPLKILVVWCTKFILVLPTFRLIQQLLSKTNNQMEPNKTTCFKINICEIQYSFDKTRLLKINELQPDQSYGLCLCFLVIKNALFIFKGRWSLLIRTLSTKITWKSLLLLVGTEKSLKSAKWLHNKKNVWMQEWWDSDFTCIQLTVLISKLGCKKQTRYYIKGGCFS